MFVIDTDPESGKKYVRPAFLRYIKNNIIRKTLMVIYTPLVLIVTFLFNLVVFNLLAITNFLQSIFGLAEMFENKYWHEPAVKEKEVKV